MTDEAAYYRTMKTEYARHTTLRQTIGEHGYRDRQTGERINTNTVEGFYSIFKRGMKGIYQHCAEKHIHRYLPEFDFRYSNRVALGVHDEARADLALRGIVGKRLTYKDSSATAAV
jgi:hypothetical protein